MCSNKNPFSLTIIMVMIFMSMAILNFAQNIKEARKTIDKLCSKEFSGRGYSNNGDKNAAEYITEKLKKLKLKSFESGYEQKFNISVNTFPGEMKVALNDSLLVAGYDYIMNGASSSISGDYPVIVMDKNLVDYPENLKKISKGQIQQSFLLIDTTNIKNKGFKDAVDDIINGNLFGAKGIIEIEYKNLMYSPSPVQQSFPRIKILHDAIPDNLKSISLNINSTFCKNYTTQNLAAFIPGEIDSFIVFSCHYDHLGEMGTGVYFPGANDNASGVAMVLDLADNYQTNQKKSKYSMAFLFFSAEEMGLLGSRYYTSNPLFPLSKIKFLVNLDMVGSGDKGITVVNGTIFRDEFDKLVEFNKAKNYLKDVIIRGPAANSDHFPFYDKGVESFFIYTLGEYSEYHSVFDKVNGLPLSEYEDLYRLLVDFVGSFN